MALISLGFLILASLALAVGLAVVTRRGKVTQTLIDPELPQEPQNSGEPNGGIIATIIGTTTVLGKQEMDCGDAGTYRELNAKTAGNLFDRDHIPSKAALQEAARQLISREGITLSDLQWAKLFGPRGLISMAGQTIAIPKIDHSSHSASYGHTRASPKVKNDAINLQKAAIEDLKAMEEADGKLMDAECVKKYMAAAREIAKKTHAEYERDLLKLIKETKERYPEIL